MLSWDLFICTVTQAVMPIISGYFENIAPQNTSLGRQNMTAVSSSNRLHMSADAPQPADCGPSRPNEQSGDGLAVRG